MLKDKLKSYRKETNLTQLQFARILGISRGYLSDLEIGKCDGGFKMLKLLELKTDLPFSYWSDIKEDIHINTKLQTLDLYLEALLDGGKVDVDTGKISPKESENILRIVQAELLLKIADRKELHKIK